MNNDLISREALKEEISKLILNWNDKTEYGQARISSYEFVLELIDNAPTVDALKDITEVHCDITKEQLLNSLRPQGEWIMDNEHTKNPLLWYKCNLCGVYHSPTNFCPNCGADMRGD